MIAIYTHAGGDVGFGHAVRMKHLARALEDRGHDCAFATKTVTDESMIALREIGIRAKDIFAYAPDAIIVDLMENDDDELVKLRDITQKLVVFVGAGHTITRRTHWIADMVVYQAPSESDYVVPGSNVLSGLEYVMLDPAIADIKPQQKDYDVAIYDGGGSEKDWYDRIAAEMSSHGLRVRSFVRGWDDAPYNDLSRSSLYFGGMGMMAYEALACGAFPIVYCRSDDHMGPANRLQLAGVMRNLGRWQPGMATGGTVRLVEDMAASPPPVSLYSELLDGYGVYRVANKILEMLR